MSYLPFALSLSGGGASSLAYAGFIHYLREHKIEPSLIAGLSGGAVMAVLMASRFTPEQAIAFVEKLRTIKLINIRLSRLEIIDHTKLTELFRDLLPYKTFEELPVPAAVFATDLNAHAPILIRSGDIASALVASCSVFPLFQPIRRRGRILADGGFTVYYGAKLLRELGIEKVIGIDVTGISESTIRGILRGFYAQLNASVTSNARYELATYPVDLDIRMNFSPATMFSIHKRAHKIVKQGETSAHKHMYTIKHTLAHHD